MPPIILASTSRYRRELLARLGLPFTTRSPGIVEDAIEGEAPEAMAARLALAKASSIAVPNALVIGSDQVASLDGRLLRKPGSAGRPLTGARVSIRDECGRELPQGEVGLIYARQPAFPDFTYNNNPEARRKIERDGLWTMGDMGYLDAEGYLYVCDRASDMVISGGVNIYPAEIEDALHRHPAVEDAAVFGVPDPEWGERVHAAVQLRAGMSATDRELMDFCRARLADYKAPREVSFHTDFPRDTAGKLVKRLLREPYWAGRTTRV